MLLDTNNGYLAVLTSKAVVRVFKLAGADAKPHAGPGKQHWKPAHAGIMTVYP